MVRATGALVLVLAVGCNEPSATELDPEPASSSSTGNGPSSTTSSDPDATTTGNAEGSGDASSAAAEEDGTAATTDATSGDSTGPGADDSSGDGVPMVDTATPGELTCADMQLPFLPPFDPRGESPEDAFWMMWFGWRALLSETQALTDELAGVGFTDYQAINVPSAGLQAFVTANDDVVVVSFRGSEEVLDWLTNLSFAQASASSEGLPGDVHVGFRTSLDAGWDDIVDAIDAFGGQERPVWLTGQSLGGALATLAAARLVDEGYTVAPLYTYANPRALDTQAAGTLQAALGGRAYRYMNANDLVPRVPPWGGAAEAAGPVLPLGAGLATSLIDDLDYTHVGQLFHFTEDAWVAAEPFDDSEDLAYWGSIDDAGWFALLGLAAQGTEHDRDTYLCLMRERAFGS